MGFENSRVPHKNKLAAAVALALSLPSASTFAQDQAVEEVVVTGIRASLSRAMDVKRESMVVSDSIASEDLGKFPDLNVAESLQRITGVAIDRSGGEGQQVTVRGFGPEYNMVLLNGRQVANDTAGREFNFDMLAAEQITGADVYKSSQAGLQEGGIGATINVKTARPFDYSGLQLAASVKGVYESLSEEASPAASALISNTFFDDRLGVLLAVSHQERNVQINRVETAGWLPGLELSNVNDGVIARDVYLPRNWDQIVDQQERTRTNGSLVIQYAPNDDLTITVDGFTSLFEIDSTVNDLAAWFEPDRVGSAQIAENGTALFFTQEQGLAPTGGSGSPRTDFVTHTRNSRDSEINGFGVNVEYLINDSLTMTVDGSISQAEDDMAGKDSFNVIGFDNNYQLDSRSGTAIVTHDGLVDGTLPELEDLRAHYNERSGFTDEDEIAELKADFEYIADSGVFQKLNFGVYHQQREKSRFQLRTDAGCAYCGYVVPVPETLFETFQASNYFSGVIDTWYAYDSQAYFDYLELDSTALRQDELLGEAPGFTRAKLGNGWIPTLQDNRYTINEDISSVYLDFTFEHDLAGMPLSVNMGARYSQTSVDVAAIQANPRDIVPTDDATLLAYEFENAQAVSGSASYGNLLPSMNIRLDLTDDMVFRYSVYKTLTRPTLALLSPATVFAEPRRQNLAASGGNAALSPIKADNWDIAFEWYFGEVSSFSMTFFNKEVDDFISVVTAQEVYGMSDRVGQADERCNAANNDACASDDVLDVPELVGLTESFTVGRPQNGEKSVVSGFEAAITHAWDFGLGVTVNATVADKDASSAPLPGLGNSQNLIVFYERGPWQARVAFNNRESFLRAADNGFNGEPINVKTYGQWDISASYDVTDEVTIFAEGINVLEEELVQTGRFENQTYSVENNGSRFAVGVRANF